MKLKVYIAARYSAGDVGRNVHNAMKAWTLLWEYGYIPYCPHWSHFQHLLSPLPYEDWLEFDKEWIPLCNVVLRLQGESRGADLEVGLANLIRLPVVYSIGELLDLYPPNHEPEPR